MFLPPSLAPPPSFATTADHPKKDGHPEGRCCIGPIEDSGLAGKDLSSPPQSLRYTGAMRIVSLLPSATEILFALGFDEEILGVSHECDFPPQAATRRRVISSRIPHGLSPSEIDRIVSEYVARGESLYSVDAAALEELAPELIVTQDLCLVCAASPDDLAAVLAKSSHHPRVVSLNPRNIADVWSDILRVGEVTGRTARARSLVAGLEARLAGVAEKITARTRPRVVLLEWLNPLFIGGHWVPEMIARAGGEDVLGQVGKPSVRITHEQVISAAPEILLIAPCGYDARQARDEYLRTSFQPGWETIPAVGDGRVFALEATAYFSRPGPRLATGVEVLAKIFHPAIEVSSEAARSFLPIVPETSAARTVSV